MECASDKRHLDRRPPRRAVTALYRGVLVAVLSVATVASAQAGGLLEKLFTGKAGQRTETPSQEDAALATVRLTVEGMVCYG